MIKQPFCSQFLHMIMTSVRAIQSQCDQMLELKKPFFQKFAIKYPQPYLLYFKKPKSHQIYGLLLQENLSLKALKNSSIPSQ